MIKNKLFFIFFFQLLFNNLLYADTIAFIDMDKLITICKKKKIFVLEDATQAMGGSINGKKIGSFGDASVISFGYKKILDCGGGGCVLTDNQD